MSSVSYVSFLGDGFGDDFGDDFGGDVVTTSWNVFLIIIL